MLQWAGVAVLQKILHQDDVALLDLGNEFSEGDPGGVDDGRLASHHLHKADPALAVQDLDVIPGRFVDVQYCF